MDNEKKNTVIKTFDLNKVYGEEVKTHALKDVNIEIDQETFCAIIGQSGSGKSTLLNMIGALDKPSSGYIEIDSIRTDKMNRNELSNLRNKKIGFIFQFHYLLPEFSVIENVLMPYKIGYKKASKEILTFADELLDEVELLNRKKDNIKKLSGGQQQRVAIVRALLNKPKIILADEPTGNLDSRNTEIIYKLMRRFNKKFGITFVIVTHDKNIAQMTDRIIEIKDGKVNMDVTVDKYVA